MTDQGIDEELGEGVRDAWLRFSDRIEPLRPELFRFALGLTHSAFDAEDLVHDGMLRAFGSLALMSEIRSPRAYLFRILTNLWIDETRRSRPESAGGEEEAMPDAAPPPDAAPELRDAAETVLGALTPRQRAAVVLKDAFDLSHAEIANVLSTSVGAVKIALHRGRRRLAAERVAPTRRPRVSRALVDRFVATFQTHDMDAMKALLIETAEAEVFPSGIGVGREHLAERGWLFGSFYHHIPDRERRRDPYPLRLEVRELEHEPVILVFRDHGRGRREEALEEVWRLEEDDGRVARIRDYGFSPDLVRWVAGHLGVPFRAVGYRFRAGIYEELAAGR